jgi:hypothetical protein
MRSSAESPRCALTRGGFHNSTAPGSAGKDRQFALTKDTRNEAQMDLLGVDGIAGSHLTVLRM